MKAPTAASWVDFASAWQAWLAQPRSDAELTELWERSVIRANAVSLCLALIDRGFCLQALAG